MDLSLVGYGASLRSVRISAAVGTWPCNATAFRIVTGGSGFVGQHLVAALLRPERRDFTGSKQLPRILTHDIRLPALEERSWQRKNNTTGERPKEKKTKRELEAMARQRLGCAAPVRRDGKGGWYFQVIEAIGLNPGTLQRRANISPKSWATSMTLKSDRNAAPTRKLRPS